MQKKSQDFSMEDVLHLAKSPAGQQLYTMLQQTDSTAMQQAAEAVSAGDYTKAEQALRHLLSSPETKELLKSLGGTGNG